jgi:hypothetical protein
MASPFQRYQSGIEASTGSLVPAYGQMAAQTANAMAGFGQNIAEGIKTYNENSQKSEAANAKIQMLGQAYADKIAMYSKDPEIAQSGILDSLINKQRLLQEAPTKGLSQRVMIAHDAETSLAGFGNQLQEWSFLRGREMERVTEEGLRRFDGETSVTSPRFSKAEEFKADPNLTLEENKAKALSYLNKVRASNPRLKGTDQEFLANWLSTAEQDIAKADPTKVPPAVISAMLEQIQADKRIQSSNAQAAKTGLVEDFLARGKMSSRADYEKTTTAAADVLIPKTENKVPTATNPKISESLTRSKENLKRLEALKVDVLGKIKKEEDNAYFRQSAPIERTVENIAEIIRNWGLSVKEEYTEIDRKTGEISLNKSKIGSTLLQRGYQSIAMPYTILDQLGAFDDRSRQEKDIIKTQINREEVAAGNAPLKTQLELIEKDIATEKGAIAGITKSIVPEKPKQTIAPIPIGEVVLGSIEETKKRTVAERQREVADFVTSRMGSIDPTDPERKRRLPVSGFDKFYKSLVPEAEIREFITDGGIRMVHANGKWEQVKAPERMTTEDIRKQNWGLFGNKTENGLMPSEYLDGSGVFLAGIYNGSDKQLEKYEEEMVKLIDARRSVKVLTEINDRVGEVFSPEAQGTAEVEVMNLASMLRTDIVGVGTVSNYEQQLIKKVTDNATNFFSLESKDRAILLALAQRVDRRIKAISTSKGLTVRIQDDRGMNKYQALREQYLREKGIL